MNAIKDWYKGLNENERNLVSILAVMMVILILFIAIVMPIKSYMKGLNQSVANAEQDLPVIASKVQALKNRAGGNKAINQSLNQLVTQTSKQYGLKFSRIEERKRDEEIQVRLDDVEFDQLLRWVSQLEQDKGLIIDTLRVSDTDVTGMVDASVKFIKSS